MLFVLFTILSPEKARDIFAAFWLRWVHLNTTYLNFTGFAAATARSWQGEETYYVSCKLVRDDVQRWKLTKHKSYGVMIWERRYYPGLSFVHYGSALFKERAMADNWAETEHDGSVRDARGATESISVIQ